MSIRETMREAAEREARRQASAAGRTLGSLLREAEMVAERQRILVAEADARAEAAEAARLRAVRAHRVVGKVNVMAPVVDECFRRYRSVVSVSERDPRVRRAILDALRDVQADITEQRSIMEGR